MSLYDGVNRREFLRVGSLSALGLGLADLLRLRSLAEDGSNRAPARNCILIWLDGGPSHLDTFDLKPNAPSEVRGKRWMAFPKAANPKQTYEEQVETLAGIHEDHLLQIIDEGSGILENVFQVLEGNMNDTVNLMQVIFNLDLIFNADSWAGAPLIPNDQATTNKAARKPSAAIAEVNAMIDGLSLAAILSDPETAKALTTAVIDSGNPKRLNVELTVQISGNANILSIDFNFGFFFGDAALAA